MGSGNNKIETCCSLSKRCAARVGDGERGTRGIKPPFPSESVWGSWWGGYPKLYVDPSGIPPKSAASSITASSCSREDMPPHYIHNKDVFQLVNVASELDPSLTGHWKLKTTHFIEWYLFRMEGITIMLGTDCNIMRLRTGCWAIHHFSTSFSSFWSSRSKAPGPVPC